MSAAHRGSSFDETALWLNGPDGPLLAVLTTPRQPSGDAALLCPGGWFGTATNRNRLLVRLARELARTGTHVLRLDWHGVGESGGEIERYELGNPFVGDVTAGLDQLESLGFGPIDLVGVCFGAHTALATAAGHPSRLRSLMLMSIPIISPAGERRPNEVTTGQVVRLATKRTTLQSLADPAVRRMYWRRLRERRRHRRDSGRRAPPGRPKGASVDPGELPRRLRSVASAGVPTYILFGEDDAYYQNFRRMLDGRLGTLVEEHGDVIRIDAVDGDLAGFGSLAAQALAIEHASSWVQTRTVGGSLLVALPEGQ